MSQNWWQGEWISNEELKNRLAQLNQYIHKGLDVSFDLANFYHCCDRFSKELLTNTELRTKLSNVLISSQEASASEAAGVLAGIAEFLQEAELRKKMTREIGTDNPFLSSRVNYDSPIFEAYNPLGFIVQIMPSNDPALPVLSAFEGLLTGNVNLIKMSSHSSDFTAQFFDAFFANKLTKNYKSKLMVVKISSKDKETLKNLFNDADGVVAWGGEEAITEIRNLCPPKVRLIEWGHRISFSYVSENKKKDDSFIAGLVKDIFIYNQQACSSPQCVYIENASFEELVMIGNKINAQMLQQAEQYLLLTPSPMEAAEIQKTTLVVETEKSFKKDYTEVIKDPQNRWRILIDSRSGLRASPLYRTIWLKPIQRDQIWDVFRPLRQYLQTVGLFCDLTEIKDLSDKFYQVGVNRVRPLGKMQESYMGEPHDGYAALARYLKKVSLESDIKALQNYATLDDLVKSEIKFSQLPDKVMSKVDFQNQKVPNHTELFFKSGGSSGDPKISYFTYHDYHLQMDAAAKGLIAAGFNPAVDKCMNLFFGGGLYGGFLSFYTILEKIQAVQFPMSAHMDFKFVGETIVKNKVNVLLGMPSYLMLLFEANHELFKNNRVIEKIYFGGEHFSELQKKRLKDEFGISTIFSASYGSVDMGPLGYQCSHSEARVHHLHQSIHFLEIYKMDKDELVQGDEAGRLIFSTLSREGQNLLRYDIGDVGRWIKETCPCGRKSPRFELLGRSGDIFRASGCFYSFNKFQQILADNFKYDREFQIKIDNEDGLDKLTLHIDKQSQLDEKQIYKTLIENYRDLDETVHEEKALILKISFIESTEFLRSEASGKLMHVIDKRVR